MTKKQTETESKIKEEIISLVAHGISLKESAESQGITLSRARTWMEEDQTFWQDLMQARVELRKEIFAAMRPENQWETLSSDLSFAGSSVDL